MNTGMFDLVDYVKPSLWHSFTHYDHLYCDGKYAVYRYRHHDYFKHGKPKRMKKINLYD